MKKNILKIAIFSLALIGLSLFVNNSDTKAATGTLQLALNAGTSTCYYGTSLTLSTGTVGFVGFDVTGSFLSNDTPNTNRRCVDLSGSASTWYMSISSADLKAGSNTINSGNVKLTFNTTQKLNGACAFTARSGTNTPLSGSVEMLTKAAGGGTCELVTSGVVLTVSVPNNQAAGTYTGTLTITTATF